VGTRDRIEDVVAALRGASEELADIAIDILGDGVREGGDKRPDLERTVTRARAAVDKAVALLEARGSDGD